LNVLPQADEPLTVREAYVAAYLFIQAYWERGLRQDEALATMLGGMNPGVDLATPRFPLDPAQWHDFIDAVNKARRLTAQGNA
jgi:hypothetical protein